jgi:Domain of unknown function (DUF4124)
MNTFSTPATLAATLLLLLPLTAAAGINKCIDANGTVSYSDQPCVTQGHKQAEVKDATGFALLAAQENQKKTAKSCVMLSERRSQCYPTIAPRLTAVFNESCEPLIKREYRDRQREQYERYRQERHPEEGDTGEARQARIPCDKVEPAMYKLVKENFGDKLSQEDVRAIEYKLMAVPSDGNEQPLTTKRGKRRY